jgi:hypothetical protein
MGGHDLAPESLPPEIALATNSATCSDVASKPLPAEDFRHSSISAARMTDATTSGLAAGVVSGRLPMKPLS